MKPVTLRWTRINSEELKATYKNHIIVYNQDQTYWSEVTSDLGWTSNIREILFWLDREKL